MTVVLSLVFHVINFKPVRFLLSEVSVLAKLIYYVFETRPNKIFRNNAISVLPKFRFIKNLHFFQHHCFFFVILKQNLLYTNDDWHSPYRLIALLLIQSFNIVRVALIRINASVRIKISNKNKLIGILAFVLI